MAVKYAVHNDDALTGEKERARDWVVGINVHAYKGRSFKDII